MIRKYNEKKAVTKQRYKEAEDEMRIQRLLEEKQKSSNRRELESHIKEKEEAEIKEALDRIRKKKQQDSWSGKDSIMNSKMNILHEDRPILKEKNIFMDHRNDIPFTAKGDMFFKW